MHKALLIDDDVKLLGLLANYLKNYQIEAVTAESAEEGLKLMDSAGPDIIILDVLMPGMDGLSLCREIRKVSDVPIIILSARGEATDRIVGLEIGADDYMAKPFEPRELVSRIQSILRRSGSRTREQDDQKIAFTGPGVSLEVDITSRDARLNGTPLQLSSSEFELLLFFCRNPGAKLSRDDIMNAVQGVDSASYSRAVDIQVSRLRNKLGEDARNPRLIKSVHGFGYVFTGEPS